MSVLSPVVWREAPTLRGPPHGLLMRANPQHPSTDSTPPVRYQDVHYVYVLRSLKDGNLYAGYTADLRSRVAADSVGKVRATCDRRPLHGGCEAFDLVAEFLGRQGRAYRSTRQTGCVTISLSVQPG